MKKKMKDVLGIAKVLPIKKLIGVVSDGVGRVCKPYFDKKDINNKAYEIEALAKARAKEIKIISQAIDETHKMTGLIQYKENTVAIESPKEFDYSQEKPALPSINERVNLRVDYQEAMKQLNIENVIACATEELKDEQPVTDEPVDKDWTTRFFNIVEEISNEEMHALWGKILAGEIKQPKSYSLRTLELIRNLSKSEADTFIKVAQFSISSSGKHYLFKGNDENKLSKDYNIEYNEIALLKEIGLLQTGNDVVHQFIKREADTQRGLLAGNIILFVNIEAETPTLQMPVEVFSTTGNELLKIIKNYPPIEYLEYFAKSIMNKDSVKVTYANILSSDDKKIKHTALQEFE
jgi:hypothetical protein